MPPFSIDYSCRNPKFNLTNDILEKEPKASSFLRISLDKNRKNKLKKSLINDDSWIDEVADKIFQKLK